MRVFVQTQSLTPDDTGVVALVDVESGSLQTAGPRLHDLIARVVSESRPWGSGDIRLWTGKTSERGYNVRPKRTLVVRMSASEKDTQGRSATVLLAMAMTARPSRDVAKWLATAAGIVGRTISARSLVEALDEWKASPKAAGVVGSATVKEAVIRWAIQNDPEQWPGEVSDSNGSF